MRKKRNFIILALLVVIGIVFGVTLEYKNIQLAELDAKYNEDWKQTRNQYDQQLIKDNNNQTNNDAQQKGLYSNFYELMENADSVIKYSKNYSSEAKGGIHAVITKEGLKQAGLNSAAVSVIPGSTIEINNTIKFTNKKDRLGNRFFGLGFYGSLPDYAESVNVANRLNVAQYFDGMQYYVGDSKDPRVQQNCDPYVDKYTPMSYDEYMSIYHNDLADLFYVLTSETLDEGAIKAFRQPSNPGDTYDVQLEITGESLAKVTDNIAQEHEHLLGFASRSEYNSLSIVMSFNYKGELIKMQVTENFDTLYAILGIKAPINVTFTYTQTFKYSYNQTLKMPSFI